MGNNDNRNSPTCLGYRQRNQSLSRRRMLNTLVSGTSGLWLTRIAERLARAADLDGSKPPKSLLMIWLQGGPSQLETFDPHPGTLIGGQTRGIATSIPGIQLADSLPATAEQLKHTTLVRSVVSKEGDHERATYHLKTGWRPDPTLVHPAIGSIVCHQSEENIEIPRHVSILPSQWPARGGYLGPALDAFQIGDPNNRIPNLTSRVDQKTTFQQRMRLWNTLEEEFQRGRMADLNRRRTLHQSATDSATTMMNSEQLSAFDVKLEGAETLARFGDSKFGRGCLAAVRLLAAGVRCVEVELQGWDSHVNNHELQTDRATLLDAPLAATIQELIARDLLNNTVVFCGGEFGRTPSINRAAGRDHWPHGFSTLLAGGGFRRGYVHGATAVRPDPQLLVRQANAPVDPAKLTEQIVSVPDLHATLLHALGIDHQQELQTPIGRPLRLSDGNIVRELLA